MKRGLITVSNEVYQYALQCRDKYLGKENQSALKLQVLIKSRKKWLSDYGKNVFDDKYVKDLTQELQVLIDGSRL